MPEVGRIVQLTENKLVVPGRNEMSLQLEMAVGRGMILGMKTLQDIIAKAKVDGIIVTGAWLEEQISDLKWSVEKRFRSKYARKV
jgi:hypothetical protein